MHAPSPIRPRIIVFAAILGCGPQVEVPSGGSTGNASTGGELDPSGGGPGASAAMTGSAATSAGTTVDPDGTTGEVATFGGHDDEDGPGFIVDIDGVVCGAGLPPGTLAHCSWCDFWAQDCPTGEKCMPWAPDGGPHWDANRCSPIEPDPAQVGQPCTVMGSEVSGIDDCDIGLMCLHVDPDTLEGTCVAMCTGSEANPICDDETTCAIGYDGAITLCLPPCDPLIDECPQGTCTAFDDLFVCFADGEAVVPGEPCEEPADCAAGSTCLPADTAGCGEGISECCTSYCDLLAPDPNAACLPGQTCTPWYRPGTVMPPLDATGVCGLQG